MLNQVILEGRLGRNPEVFMAHNGRQVAKFSLATSSTWKDDRGEWQTKTYWHTVVIHRDSTIRWIRDALKQGDFVRVEGKLTYHYWTDRHDQQRRKTQISVTDHYGKVEHADDPKKPKSPAGKLKNTPPLSEVSKHSEPTDLDHQSLRNLPFLAPQPNPHQQTGESL